jgi:hypothetical protein
MRVTVILDGISPRGRVCRPCVWVGWGPKVHQAKALPSLADPLVEGVVVATWSSPWRSSSRGVLHRGCFAAGRSGRAHSLSVEFCTSTLDGSLVVLLASLRFMSVVPNSLIC